MVLNFTVYFRNCINLLSNIPAKYTDPLLTEPDLTLMTSFQLEHYDGHCMNSTRIMMDFLIVSSSVTESRLRESLMPVLTVMTKFARHHRYIFRLYFLLEGDIRVSL